MAGSGCLWLGHEVFTNAAGYHRRPILWECSWGESSLVEWASRKLIQGGKAPLVADGAEKMVFMPVFLCQCMFAQAKQNPLRITLLLAYIRHSSQNRPRILSSVQRENVLFQSVNVSLFSYRMIVSWSKHAALGQAPDHKATFGMHFPPGTL